ncbi:MAG: ABC transporter permease, partial [Anaerolineales bacterium]
FVFRRLIGLVAVMLGVSIITFALSHVVPGDPAVAALGDHATDAQIAAFRAQYGLDQPLPTQYVIYIRNVFQGDLGLSIRTRRPVSEDLRNFFPATLELSVAALLIALALGLPLGIWSALAHNKLPDYFVRLFALAGGSLPIFWLGLIFIGVLYGKLGLLPSGGRLDQFLPPPPTVTGLYVIDSLLAGNATTLANALRHLILPAFTLGYFSTAVIARMMRSSMLEVLRHDYILAARAKGLTRRKAILKHGLRNALLPTLTVIGVTFGSLLSGAVLTETIFSWPGLGGYATTSAISLDFPAVMGVTLLAAFIYPLANLLVDLGYHWLDPRIRYG